MTNSGSSLDSQTSTSEVVVPRAAVDHYQFNTHNESHSNKYVYFESSFCNPIGRVVRVESRDREKSLQRNSEKTRGEASRLNERVVGYPVPWEYRVFSPTGLVCNPVNSTN